jgi:DNA-binding NarL/FixJ family response regulator
VTAQVSTSLRLTVLVADPGDISRNGLAMALADDPRFSVVGETAAVKNMFALARRRRPRVIVLDPDAGGRLDLRLIAGLARVLPESRICVHTAVAAPCAVHQAMQAGARSYLLKGSLDGEPLRDLLFQIGRADLDILGPGIGQQFRALPPGAFTLRQPAPDAPRVTDRERELLVMVAEGAEDKEIAARFHVGHSTAENYVARLRAKLGARNRPHLAALAIRLGLVDG